MGATFSGWTVVGEAGSGVGPLSTTFTQLGFSFPAHEGAQTLDLTGLNSAMTGVIQVVKTTPGVASGRARRAREKQAGEVDGAPHYGTDGRLFLLTLLAAGAMVVQRRAGLRR